MSAQEHRLDLDVHADVLIDLAELVADDEQRAIESVLMGVVWAALERYAHGEEAPTS